MGGRRRISNNMEVSTISAEVNEAQPCRSQ